MLKVFLRSCFTNVGYVNFEKTDKPGIIFDGEFSTFNCFYLEVPNKKTIFAPPKATKMSEYIVSARKYRPTSFDEVVGQKALTTTLKNAVKSGKLAHAFLFCGPRGVGKTTCARIFAKAINCMAHTDDGEACGHCESCRSFEEQRSLNIFELDAASNNSVEHIKSLMEQTHIPPQVGKYKVFIIDEVHMLSTSAFNAFLKTLEEPPAHVVFILATTEKHKILPTILSRCQTYDFDRMGIADIVGHLKNVARQENVEYEDEALAVIAEKADGGMRDALSIFDQAASYSQGNITYKSIIENLNVPDAEYYFNIIDKCHATDAKGVMLLINEVLEKGFDAGQFMGGLAKHTRNVMMAQDTDTVKLIDCSEKMRERYKLQAKTCSTNFLYKALRIMNNCEINYRQSTNKRLLVELSLIEMAQIEQKDDEADRRKPKRLKSLFKNSSSPARHTKPAMQVAAAKREAEKAVDSSHPVPQRPTLKDVGFSWKNLKKEAEKPKKGVVNILLTDLKEIDPNRKNKDRNAEFTQDDLEFQWMSMCLRMPTQYKGIASRLQNIVPHITEMPKVEVVVDNQVLKDQITPIIGSITKTLRLYLSNEQIQLDVRVAAPQEIKPILSRQEQYEEMAKENPALELLRKLMDLEFA